MTRSESAAVRKVSASRDDEGDEVRIACMGLLDPVKACVCFSPNESGSIMYAVSDAQMTAGWVGTGRARVVACMVGIERIL